MQSFLNEVLIIVVLIGVNAFFAGAEIAILSVRDVRIRQLAEDGHRGAKTVLRLSEDSSRMLATIQIGITLAGFMASAAAAVGISSTLAAWFATLPIPWLARFGHALSVIVVTLIISYFTLVFGELAPKRLALQKAEAIALRVARPIELLARLAGPVTSFLTWSTNMAVRFMGGNPNDKEDEVTEEEIKAFVAEHGSLPDDEKDMIHSIFEFGDSTASDIMVPRIDIVAVHDKSTIGEAVATLRESGYSRIPVYHDSVDNIVGVVNLKDLLDHLLDGRQEQSVKPVMRRPLIVPEQKKAIALLHEMQKLRVHMAVVADEFGGTAGIVTMEDLVEEVVGDIRDEHDTDEQDDFTVIDDNEVIVLGNVSLREINDELDWHLPDHEDYDTIGGLVFFYLGRIPAMGDKVELKEITVTVEKMEGRRVERVRLKRPAQDQADGLA